MSNYELRALLAACAEALRHASRNVTSGNTVLNELSVRCLDAELKLRKEHEAVQTATCQCGGCTNCPRSEYAAWLVVKDKQSARLAAITSHEKCGCGSCRYS